MKLKKPRVGDIYINPVMGDLWILKKDYDIETDKEVWVFSLVHDSYEDLASNVSGFARIGNIYEMVAKEIESRCEAEFKNEK